MVAKVDSETFLSALAARRTIYSLSKKTILPDKSVVKIVQEAVKQSPTSFNSQSSRAVMLLGKEQDEYWSQIVHAELKKVAPPEAFPKSEERLKGFQKFQKDLPDFKDQLVPQVGSARQCHRAQLSTRTALEQEGYGANLQHYGNLIQTALKQRYSLPESFELVAELVFGHPEGTAKEKDFLPDEERVRVFGGNL